MENAVLFYLIRTGFIKVMKAMGFFSLSMSNPLLFPCTSIQQLLPCDLLVHTNIDRDCLVGSALGACAQRGLLTLLFSMEGVSGWLQMGRARDKKACLPAPVNDNRHNEAHPKQEVKDESHGPPTLPPRGAIGTCGRESEQRDPDLEAVAKGHHGALGLISWSASRSRRYSRSQLHLPK